MIETRIHTHGNEVTFESIQDCTPILENTTRLHNEGAHGSSEMKHAARIPFVIIEKYCNDNNLLFSEFMGNPDHMKRICNDPSLSGFRIWKGQL
jgi:hypothetical protein